ncbi:Cytochrome c551/c552 [hydrothermal vent metagenome]|uniref:Cytochrome c551/c552 n=1 Tax=hydrothermal vent metagenome TaxID=652676 RepID=A0A3B1DXA3_9ZZZZ
MFTTLKHTRGGLIRLVAVAFSLVLGAQGAIVSAQEADGTTAITQPRSVLIYSRTVGFRHASIPDGIAALQALGTAHGFLVVATEDPAHFTDETLDQYAVVVFLSTTGDILNDDQQGAFERFIAKGRGFVGIHAAADTEYDWPWYGKLVGGYFKSHPPVQPADLLVIDRDHPATAHLDEVWHRTDEWYNYRQNPRGRVRVLIELDESTYKNGGMGDDHPIAWCHEFGGGRAFYTGGGHTSESFTEPEFLAHLLGAIRWAAGEDQKQNLPISKQNLPALK